MSSANIAKFKSEMGKFLKIVRGGGEVVLLDRNHPVAKIIPWSDQPIDLRIAPAEFPLKNLKVVNFLKGKSKVDSLEFLLEERGDR